ncbi:MAG: hypothetical protein F7C34_01700 [Desulfurococcales archaeon]|nr:hypothetical protein [Desulfurococcales archaeon]
MQASKAPRLRRARREEERLFEAFCRDAGFEPAECAAGVYALEVPGGSYVELFDPPREVLEFAEKHLDMIVYSVGLYLGLADTAKQRFRPSLPLAHRLAEKCEADRCCRVDSRGEKRFLYGRQVIPVHAPPRKVCIVTNSLGEALGWARVLVKSKNGRPKTTLVPVIDLGWYLRRGG